MQLTIKTILNQVHPLKHFVYCDIWMETSTRRTIYVHVVPRKRTHALCSGCQCPAPGYDTLPKRHFSFIPMWMISVVLIYAMRRVACPGCGIKVEEVPWACGKCQMAKAYMLFLSGWAKRLAWRTVAGCFNTSWDSVRRSVGWVVEWGLAHRDLKGISAIGIDEIHWAKGKGSNCFLTLVYQIDEGRRRLLWVGRKRTAATLNRFFKEMGPEVVAGLRFICSDMWRPYLKVIRQKAAHALNILDPFHIAKKLNDAIDEIRRKEISFSRKKGNHLWLVNMRWVLLKRWKNLRRHQRTSLREILGLNLKTIRAYMLKEDFANFWHYRSLVHAKDFLKGWLRRARQSRLEPMRKVADTLQNHEPLLLNWFKAKGMFNSSIVEGLNNKVRVVTRRSYGFRTYPVLKLVLFHTMGELPEPHQTHKFC